MLSFDETNPWKIIAKETVYENKWIQVIHHQVINPAGTDGIYGKVHFKNKAIAAIPVDADGNTYLVGQYRFPTNKYSWELPEGGCPKEEDSLETAKRELLEETGLKADKWQRIGGSYLSNSVCDEWAEYFVGTQLTQFDAEPEETEQLMVKKLPLQEVFKMVSEGVIDDSLSILALQKLELMLLKGEITL